MYRPNWKNALYSAGSLLATMLFVFIFSSDVQAQCTPDCHGDAWSAPQTQTLTLDPCPYTGCVVDVTYVTRLACGYFRDIQITEIKFEQSCNCTNEKLVQATFKALITGPNPPWPLPEAGTCDEQFRISIASCFSEFTYTIGGPEGKTFTFLVPCLGEACCYTGVLICVSTGGSIVELYPGAPHDEVDCSDAIPAQGLSQCFTTCEFEEIAKSSSSPINSGQVQLEALNQALTLPNPASGSTVDIELHVNRVGVANLAVYDLQGRMVAQTEVELREGPTRVTLDVGNLQAGTYIYELTAAGYKLVNDKLIIER